MSTRDKGMGSMLRRLGAVTIWCVISAAGPAPMAPDRDAPGAVISGFRFHSGSQCEEEGSDPWVRQLSSDLLARDGLLSFALSEFGPVVACAGEVTQRFDGRTFGQIAFEVGGGVTVEFETMPPAVWTATVSHPNGFVEETRLLEVARSYAAGLGLQVVWDGPERSSREGVDREQYWDPDPGLNGSVTVMRRQGVLVAIRVSMAP
ncbi:MAG: hypothetical protein HKN73_20825 [Gemmatimonadetes bacterium]|nr:hypothetical protein [Gemmatimonadota bacterium]